MTISGLALFKLLPGGKKLPETNCKECGFPTCMAFAMKLAKGQTTIDKCKYASDEIKEVLESQGGKKQEELTFGPNSNPLKIGGETVINRHDKTFINPTCLSIRINTSQDRATINKKIETIASYSVERIGVTMSMDSLTIFNDSNDNTAFISILNDLIAKDINKTLSLILVNEDKEALIEATRLLTNSQKPLLYLKKGTKETYQELYNMTKCPIVIESETIDDLAKIAEELDKASVSNIVLAIKNDKNIIETLTLIRRSIIAHNVKALRFPVMSFASDYCSTKDPAEEALWAGNLICKYSNIVIMSHFDPALIYSLFTLRQNLFTDPQKPLQIEPKLYQIGDTDKDSPLIVTTNFALTYFSVASEVEASNVPCHLLITPSDGMSVLTAWAANKFSGEIIAKAIKDNKIEDLLSHKNLIIPGYVSMLKEEIEEELPEWKIHIAPLEAVDIPEYLKKYDLVKN